MTGDSYYFLVTFMLYESFCDQAMQAA
ncbi:hypothetical protein PSAB6_10181 [Paraburkholderia sabiae]|nr:hypothetical protein PSAB6_10181 [Paraburkholderia sabiae]